ncbi:FtsX-like permease family protein [Candidatus Bathyarchaeota archaeon]|nr:FtsX-like permease family protein [Candidatus Bathyarchaeota archaeon]
MLSEKLLLRRPGTVSAILALALLVAIIASMNSVINYVNAQSEALAGLVRIGETYIILSRNATALTDSHIDARLANCLYEIDEISQAFPQKLLKAHLKTASANLAVNIRVVENLEDYLKFNAASLKGTFARNSFEADVGEVLAGTAGITVGAKLTFSTNGKTFNIKVVGVYRTQSPLDAEILIPLAAVGNPYAEDAEISIIEFKFKPGVDRAIALKRMAERLPSSIRIVKVQQPIIFMQNINMQTITFLNVWSIAVYAIIVAASYVITLRLMAESSYEIAVLKALGAKKRHIFASIMGYAIAVAALGLMLGIALGLVGAQTASTILKWLQPTVEMSPFLEAEDILKTLVLTLASSILGCAYPAYKSASLGYMEKPL